MILVPVLSILACTGGASGPAEDSAVGTHTTPPTLPLPDVDGVDWPKVYEGAMAALLSVDPREPWAAHRDSLSLAQAGCPDLYVGAPDPETEVGEGGLSWSDRCDGEQASFGGFVWWAAEVSVRGDPESAKGQSTEGSRRMVADGTVSLGDEVLLELDGELEDSLSLSIAPGYEHWSYASTVDATVGGSLGWAADGPTPGGYRAELYLYYSGGDVDALEARGNLFLPEARLSERFDSAAVDLAFTGSRGAPPDACTEEPVGFLSVRDEQAFWYDLVFLPRYEDDATDTGSYANDPYADCDGCGTLYIRGVEQPQLEVCPDLSYLWSGALAPPAAEDFVLTLRDLSDEETP